MSYFNGSPVRFIEISNRALQTVQILIRTTITFCSHDEVNGYGWRNLVTVFVKCVRIHIRIDD